MRRVWLSTALFSCLAACGKSQGDVASKGTIEPAARGMPTTTETATTPASPRAANNAASVPAAWSGAYTSVPGTLYVPADWKNVHWKPAESTAGLGDGSLTFSVDARDRVRGELSGPLGPALIDGYAAGGKLTGSVFRADPTDRGFTGTLVGTMATGHAEGTISMSPADASAIRTVTFSASTSRGGLR